MPLNRKNALTDKRMTQTQQIKKIKPHQVGERLIDRFDIKAHLSHGKSSSIYLVHDRKMNQKRVCKEITILDDLATTELEREQIIANFRHLANILDQIKHPNLPQCFYFQKSDDFKICGQCGEALTTKHCLDCQLQPTHPCFKPISIPTRNYLLMQYIDGQSLSEMIKSYNKPLHQKQILGWLKQMISALKVLHQNQLLHLDLCPDNLIIAKKSHDLFIIDVNLVMMSESDTPKQNLLAIASPGTPGYMAPEQINGHFHPANDIFGLGRTLYYLATNLDPSQSENQQKLQQSPREFNPKMSRELAQLIEEMTAPFEERIKSVLELEQRFQQLFPAKKSGKGKGKPKLKAQASSKDKIATKTSLTKPTSSTRKSTKATPTAREYAEQSHQALQDSNYPEALNLMEQALALTPASEYYLFKGDILVHLKQYSEALQAYSEGIKLDSESIRGYLSRGILYFNMGNIYQAFPDFNKVIEQDKYHSQANYLKGSIRVKNKHIDSALKDFSRALKQTHDNPDYHYSRGYCLFMTTIEAKHNFNTYYNEAESAYKRFLQAQEDFENTLSLKPDHNHAKHYQLLIQNQYLPGFYYDNLECDICHPTYEDEINEWNENQTTDWNEDEYGLTDTTSFRKKVTPSVVEVCIVCKQEMENDPYSTKHQAYDWSLVTVRYLFYGLGKVPGNH